MWSYNFWKCNRTWEREREGESIIGRSLKNSATCVGPAGFVFLVDLLVDSVKCVELSSSFQTARLTIMHYRAVPQSFKGGEPESPADSQVILNFLSFTCHAYINKSHYRLYLCSQDTNILHYLLLLYRIVQHLAWILILGDCYTLVL